MTNPRRPQETYPVQKRRVLIAHDDHSIARKLGYIFRTAHLNSERVKTVRAACESLQSGRFQVVFAAPALCDGAWHQISDFAKGCKLAPPIVVVARAFDLQDWGESLKRGAFDVLDILNEIPKAAEMARQAFSSTVLPNLTNHHDLSGLDGSDGTVQAQQRRI